MAASCGTLYNGGADLVFLTFLKDDDHFPSEVAHASLPPMGAGQTMLAARRSTSTTFQKMRRY